jgi:3-methyl-2-oxobutanoate hydroxymethyltransferase
MKAAGQKITMLTAYDYTMAGLLDAAGVEGILVGDSMSMVVQGHPNTLPVTLDEMIYHAEMVGRAVHHALVVVDMPFPSYHLGTYRAVESAGRILKETRCQAVKLEGGTAQAEVIAAIVSAGIPVMAHCGLRPQTCISSAATKSCDEEGRLLPTPPPPRAGGTFAVVLSCIPQRWRRLTARLSPFPPLASDAGSPAVTADPRHPRSFGPHQRLPSPGFATLPASVTVITDANHRIPRRRSRRQIPSPDQAFN